MGKKAEGQRDDLLYQQGQSNFPSPIRTHIHKTWTQQIHIYTVVSFKPKNLIKPHLSVFTFYTVWTMWHTPTSSTKPLQWDKVIIWCYTHTHSPADADGWSQMSDHKLYHWASFTVCSISPAGPNLLYWNSRLNMHLPTIPICLN